MKRWFNTSLGGWLVLALIFAGLAGCGKKKEPAAARVGKDEILLSSVAEAFEKGAHLFRSAEEELAEKEKFLNLLVEERLLIQEAYRRNMDRDSSVKSFEAAQKPLFLIDHLYVREIRDKVRLSNREMENLYAALKNDRCLKQILTHDQKTAEELMARLRRGENFDSLAFKFSKDRLSLKQGGKIGCYGWSQRLPQHFEELLKMKPGDLAGPLGFSFGWVIFFCHELRPAQTPPLEAIGPELRNLVQSEREERRGLEFVREVRKEVDYQLVDSVARLANALQQELSKVETPGKPVQYSIRIRTEELPSSQRNLSLITYEGGRITLGRYLNVMQGSLPGNRPVLDTSEVTKALLFQLIFQDAMLQAARARKLDKDPQYLRTVQKAVEGQMALRLKNETVSPVQIDSAAARNYFNAHPEEFVVPPAAHLFEINRPNEADFAELKNQLKNKPQFLVAANQLTSRIQLRPSGGDLGWVEEFQFPELYLAAAKMKTGQIAGPVPLGDGSFSLIYLEERRPARKQKFAEVQGALFQRLLARARDSAYAVWFSGQKQQTKVTLYPEALKKTIDYPRYAKLKELEARKEEKRS